MAVDAKTGKVKVRKGTAKGTRRIRVKVGVAGAKNHQPSMKIIIATVRVKQRALSLPSFANGSPWPLRCLGKGAVGEGRCMIQPAGESVDYRAALRFGGSGLSMRRRSAQFLGGTVSTAACRSQGSVPE